MPDKTKRPTPITSKTTAFAIVLAFFFLSIYQSFLPIFINTGTGWFASMRRPAPDEQQGDW